MDFLTRWFKRTFSDPQVVLLALILVTGFAVLYGLGRMLAPVIASVVIAYLLEAAVGRCQLWGLPRLSSVLIVFALFMATLVFLLFGLVPRVSGQLSQLVQQLPSYITQGQTVLEQLPERYPEMVSEDQVSRVISSLGADIGRFGQGVLRGSLASVASLLGLIVFLVLVPVLVFFLLKDKELLIAWLTNFIPRERDLVTAIWVEVEAQIANYVRGKAGEIIIVGAVSYITFLWMGLQYSALLATLVGFSVLIPYIGAAVVTVPIAVVAYFQWGWGWDFGKVMIAYGIIQALDGNVLVPLMFSEVVDLHPVAIIVAILVFGGLWGFWGVFFAIPLATLVQAVLRAWPRAHEQVDADHEAQGSEA
jgi:putative permease